MVSNKFVVIVGFSGFAPTIHTAYTTRITRRCLLDLSDKVVGRTFTQQKPSSMIQVINCYQSRHLCGTLKEIRKVLTG
jgi:hypothetical protein